MKTTQNQIDEGLAKAANPQKRIKFAYLEPAEAEALAKTADENASSPLEKSVLNSLWDINQGKSSITRIAFDEDPRNVNYYQSLWIPKRNQIPDEILKRISIQDDLVAAIWMGRANHISSFGRELQDRFATGFRIEPRRGLMESASKEQKESLKKRIEAASKLLAACGRSDGVEQQDKMSLAEFLYIQARNSIIFGRHATELTYVEDINGERKFHSFRPVDAGTIYQASPHTTYADAIRKQALELLKKLKNNKLKPEHFQNDEYSWIQVIAGRPLQAFTDEELAVQNMYPITDYELQGYPVTPIDTAIAAITTHINITNHNKLYFASGRAARGMIVIKSNDVSQDLVGQIKQQFNASINGVQNSWRVPVFGIDPEDSVEWEPMEMQGGRDMEFQYLADSNARVILSAFQMSPEELPGYAHLSRGTNNQALSESNNEYKMEAARDVGIRPLMAKFQDFLNERILPLLDPDVAKLCTLKLYGLDADTAEKESTRFQQDMSIHLTYDEIMTKTEKDPIGVELGGKFPLNPGIQGIMDKYLPVGMICEKLLGMKDASKDPNLAYVRDPFWFNFQQLQMQAQQMQQQQQQGPPPPDGGGEGGEGGDPNAQQQVADAQQGQDEKEQQENEPPAGGGEIEGGVDQLIGMLGKSEQTLSPNKKKLLAQHRATVKAMMDEWENGSKELLAEVINTTAKRVKKK